MSPGYRLRFGAVLVAVFLIGILARVAAHLIDRGAGVPAAAVEAAR